MVEDELSEARRHVAQLEGQVEACCALMEQVAREGRLHLRDMALKELEDARSLLVIARDALDMLLSRGKDAGSALQA